MRTGSAGEDGVSPRRPSRPRRLRIRAGGHVRRRGRERRRGHVPERVPAIELPQHVLDLSVRPAGSRRSLSAKAVVVLGKVSGSIQASELVRIGEGRLDRRRDRAFAVGCGRRGALAGPRGRVGLGTMFVCERASLGRPDAAVKPGDQAARFPVMASRSPSSSPSSLAIWTSSVCMRAPSACQSERSWWALEVAEVLGESKDVR